MIHEEQIEISTIDDILSAIENRNIFLQIWDNIISIFDNIKYTFFCIKYGIENIIYYLPIIWKDRDWDNEYILDLLKHKLKKNKKNLLKYSCCVGAKENAEEIQSVIDLINAYPNICIDIDPDYKELNYIETLPEDEKKYWLKRYFKASVDIENDCYKMIFDILGEYSQKWWW